MAAKKDSGRAASPRFGAPIDRAAALAGNSASAQAFEVAALGLIAGHRPSDEWTESERLAMRIAGQLAQAFRGGEPAGWAPMLRRALAAFGPAGVEQQRYWAARSIAELGSRWAGLEADSEARERALGQCFSDLEFCDTAFAVLREAGPRTTFLDLLRAYDPSPRGKRGKKGAAAILAELIVQEGLNVLGLADEGIDDDDTDAAERLRKRIDADVRDYFSPRTRG